MSNLYGVSAYQQTTKTWNQATKKTDETSKKQSKSNSTEKTDESVKTTEWKPIDLTSSLVPKKTDDYGMAVGDVKLSDTAKDYYNKLKEKHGNMEFIVVSADMKSAAQSNVSAYGNALKQVVLIDEEKLEKMATDEDYRKKYESLIESSSAQLESAKNSLASSGASIKNFGITVNADGTTDFFATVEKASDNQAKMLEKKQAAKKAEKAKEKKLEKKKENEERIEKAREKNKAKQEELEEMLAQSAADDSIDETMADDKEYVEIKATSFDDLVSQVSRYAYENSSKNVLTEAEKSVGQNIDFVG